LFFDLTLKLPIPEIGCEAGVMVKLLVPAAETVVAEPTVTLKEPVEPPFLRTERTAGLMETPPHPVLVAGPVVVAVLVAPEQSPATAAGGAFVPPTTASLATSLVLLTLV
jgi:hypothetical protein